jgi:hypothetical protein
VQTLSAEKLLRFGVGGNKLLSSFNQVINSHSEKSVPGVVDVLYSIIVGVASESGKQLFML